MKKEVLQSILASVISKLREDNLYVESLLIKERRSKFEIYIKLGSNPLGVKTIKIIFSKKNFKFRVFSSKTSIELRLKRLIERELAKSGVKK